MHKVEATLKAIIFLNHLLWMTDSVLTKMQGHQGITQMHMRGLLPQPNKALFRSTSTRMKWDSSLFRRMVVAISMKNLSKSTLKDTQFKLKRS
jgi:hypothetical protein